MWPFPKKINNTAFHQAFERATVETTSHIPFSVKNAKSMIDALGVIDSNSKLAEVVFPTLLGTYSGDALPAEMIELFDDLLPENHVFFEGDKMDILSKTFFESVLIHKGNGSIRLDTSHFDRQFRKIDRDLSHLKLG